MDESVVSTRTMQIAVFISLFLSLALCDSAVAQPSPYGAVDGNLGTWTWDKPQSPKSDEDEERPPGETSWERLNAEHRAEAAQPPKEETPKSLSPLQLWRLLRGKDDEQNVKQNDEQNDE